MSEGILASDSYVFINFMHFKVSTFNLKLGVSLSFFFLTCKFLSVDNVFKVVKVLHISKNRLTETLILFLFFLEAKLAMTFEFELVIIQFYILSLVS